MLETACKIIDEQLSVIAVQKAVLDNKEGRLISVGKFICTAYEASAVSCGKWADGLTATLVPVGLGIAAADPKVLPYNTIIYLENLNRYFIVLDRGSAIKGNRLDLYTESVADAMRLGKFNSMVYIVN